MKVVSETSEEQKIEAEERERLAPFSYFMLYFAISKKPDNKNSDLKSNTSGYDYSCYKLYFSFK